MKRQLLLQGVLPKVLQGVLHHVLQDVLPKVLQGVLHHVL